MAVYFVQPENDSAGPIKIGFSVDIRKRLQQLNVSNIARLRVLAEMPGTVSDEAALHRRFDAHRLHGEWFSPVPELLELIASIPPMPVVKLVREKTPEDFRGVMELWPGPTAMGADIGVSAATITLWKHRNSIPVTHLLPVWRAAQRRGDADVTLELLVEMAAARAEARTLSPGIPA